MPNEITTPIISATAALLGSGVTAYFQGRTQRRNQDFDLASSKAKHAQEQADRYRDATLLRLADGHKLLSKMAREFSVTNLDILWRSNMTDGEYDQRYLQACQEMDDLRAFAAPHQPSVAEDVEKLNSQMNHFWGNFKNVLYLTQQGTRVDHNSKCLMDTHSAALEAGKIAKYVKGRFADLAAKIRAGE